MVKRIWQEILWDHLILGLYRWSKFGFAIYIKGNWNGSCVLVEYVAASTKRIKGDYGPLLVVNAGGRYLMQSLPRLMVKAQKVFILRPMI
jgi:hypothetical protein